MSIQNNITAAKTPKNIRKASKIGIEKSIDKTVKRVNRSNKLRITKAQAQLTKQEKQENNLENETKVKRKKRVTPSPLKRKTQPRAEFHKKNKAHRYAYNKNHKDSYIGKEVRYANLFDTIAQKEGVRKVYQDQSFVLERLYNFGHEKERKKILCSGDKKVWTLKPIEEAIQMAHIRINPTEVCYYLMVDVDSTSFDELLARFKEIGVYPQVMIGREGNDKSWHLWFGLQYTEFKNWHVLQSVLNLLTLFFYGDTNYTNNFSRSPFSDSHIEHTYMFDIANYDIDDLDRRLQIALDRRPRREYAVIKRCLAQLNEHKSYIHHIADISSGSRNVDTFRLFTREARNYINKNMMNDGRATQNKVQTLMRFLLNNVVDKNPDVVLDLNSNELKGIAKSVANYNLDSLKTAARYNKFSKSKDNSELPNLSIRPIDEIIDNMLSEKNKHWILEMATKPITSSMYDEIVGIIGCSKSQAQYAIKAIRALYCIQTRKSKREHIEDTVLAVKKAKYETVANREKDEFDRVDMQARLKALKVEGQKIRKAMRENGATEKQVAERLAYDMALIKSERARMKEEIENPEWEYVFDALDEIDEESKYSQQFTHLPSSKRFEAVIQYTLNLVNEKKEKALQQEKLEKELMLKKQQPSKRKLKNMRRTMGMLLN